MRYPCTGNLFNGYVFYKVCIDKYGFHNLTFFNAVTDGGSFRMDFP